MRSGAGLPVELKQCHLRPVSIRAPAARGSRPAAAAAGDHTISSLHIGQDSCWSVALEGRPRLMLEVRSWVKVPKAADADGDAEEDPTETLLSDGANGLRDRLTAPGGIDGAGGASPLPLPRIRPPPSLRPDIWAVGAWRPACRGEIGWMYSVGGIRGRVGGR